VSAESFDVVVISRFQIKAPNLGVSKAYDQMISSLNSMGLSVCLVVEGQQITSQRVSSLLTLITVPASKKKVKAIWTMGIPHPVSMWLVEVQQYLQFGKIVIAPIVGMQSSVFKTRKTSKQFYVSTLHTPYSRNTLPGLVYFRIQMKSLELTDVNIANSTTVVNKLGIKWNNKIAIIPHSIGIRRQEFSQIALNKKTPMWIGALTYRKGVDRLIRLIILSRGKQKFRVVWSK
jgi:glycosyltransferase involved in cell wall biosynthesis